jgi:hypothetical protein
MLMVEGIASAVVSIGVVSIECDGFVEVSDGAVIVAFVVVDEPEVITDASIPMR